MTGRASAPASSANLGPGFDFLALALELRTTVTVTPAKEWTVSRDASAIVKGVVAALEIDGAFDVVVESEVPVGRGLGSSAALAVASGAAAMRSAGRDAEPAVVFKAAAIVEGHPDNAAASVFGGLVAVAASGPRRMSLAPTLLPIVAVPNRTLPTAEARDALPKTLPHAAAARSAARAAFLIEGLRTADAAALASAAGDELHEGPRSQLSPMTGETIEVARAAGALHACWSGAGPSVLALATADTIDAVAGALAEALGSEGTVLRPSVAASGLD